MNRWGIVVDLTVGILRALGDRWWVRWRLHALGHLLSLAFEVGLVLLGLVSLFNGRSFLFLAFGVGHLLAVADELDRWILHDLIVLIALSLQGDLLFLIPDARIGLLGHLLRLIHELDILSILFLFNFEIRMRGHLDACASQRVVISRHLLALGSK